MFTKVLVANRGEIACRIIRTLHKMGIASVAVFSDADRESLHVEMARESVALEGTLAGETYLNQEKILRAARETGAQAIHPGYGFLSENSAFARACRTAGILFIGPTPENMLTFGLKHRAREAATTAGVDLLPGTGLLDTPEAAFAEAGTIGYPVILKSTGGGGGIGMKICFDKDDLNQAFTSVKALAQRNFKDSGVYLEKYVREARHVEVQVFGDGKGGIVILGDRDCSAQRRNQKVVEETPAPGLGDSVRWDLQEAARKLTSHAAYASAGTVEFVYDAREEKAYFLEVNTRLQVEHTVTEEVWGVDLVEWMVLQAAGLWSLHRADDLIPKGFSLQARLYAEDPGRQFQPCDGLVTQTQWPETVRVETWVRPGVVMTTHYDPLLAKIISRGRTREEALANLLQALDSTRLGGIQTNRSYLIEFLKTPTFREARTTTGFLGEFIPEEAVFEVLSPGTQTTVQDWPGRIGFWQVGIPPSGPMDDLSFRLGNRLLCNPQSAAGLEVTLSGPTLRFRKSAILCLTGAAFDVEVDGVPQKFWTPFRVERGQTLRIGNSLGEGQRAYLLFTGGLEVPEYLGSRGTFTLGGFGGHGGRALMTGDVIPFSTEFRDLPDWPPIPLPVFGPGWDPRQIRVVYGPQGAPEFFHQDYLEKFLETQWEVHFNSSRTGVRLIGPAPDWPRADGGEAGLHPSNLHDNPYALGALDFTGDMPVILGPDGPSLGGFVCPFTIIRGDLWKMGQLKPGDRVKFTCVTLKAARDAAFQNDALATDLVWDPVHQPWTEVLEDPLLRTWNLPGIGEVCVKRSGDRAALVEFGTMTLDLKLRLGVQWLLGEMEKASLPGVLDLTPGIRSLQVHLDDRRTTWEDLLGHLDLLVPRMPPLEDIRVPSRTVWLPMSWDDPSTRLAIEKYMTAVRPDAPWCPWNIEFIRRINGLENWEKVRDIVFTAEYLVLGLGDVYLGAPVATPLDPRHRLVTTKYNPARTWTPENAVGIGGAYLCVYGMEGPGGYQFVGRTVQMWNRFYTTKDFPRPWLLRFFDRIRFYPVSAEELTVLRREFPLGRRPLFIENGEFFWGDYQKFLDREKDSIEKFSSLQKAAFAVERAHWKATGADSFQAVTPQAAPEDVLLEAGHYPLESPVSGVLWQVNSTPGQWVKKGESLAVVESMKMEIHLESPRDGEIVRIYLGAGDPVRQGQVVLAVKGA